METTYTKKNWLVSSCRCTTGIQKLDVKQTINMLVAKPLYDSGKWHSTKKPVTTMLTYPWKCTVLHCNHLGNTWKPLVLMTWHFDYCPSTSEGDNQSVRSSAPVVSRCFPGGYNVKLYISRGRLVWWLLAFLHSVNITRADIINEMPSTTGTSLNKVRLRFSITAQIAQPLLIKQARQSGQ